MRPLLSKGTPVFKNFLHMAYAILFPITLMPDQESSQMYIRYQLYMLPKVAAGQIHDEESLVDATMDFLHTVIDED